MKITRRGPKNAITAPTLGGFVFFKSLVSGDYLKFNLLKRHNKNAILRPPGAHTSWRRWGNSPKKSSLCGDWRSKRHPSIAINLKNRPFTVIRSAKKPILCHDFFNVQKNATKITYFFAERVEAWNTWIEIAWFRNICGPLYISSSNVGCRIFFGRCVFLA